MLTLSDSLLRPDTGRIAYLAPSRPGPDAGTWSISVPLLPFCADDRLDPHTFRPGVDGPELIETEIGLEFIDLPGSDLGALAGRTFDFPVNPDDGYIDGSVYLGGVHNPVDVTRIEFGAAQDQSIDAVLHAAFDFTQEGVAIENRSAVLRVVLRYERID